MIEQSVDRGAVAVWRVSSALVGAFVLLVFAVVAFTSNLPGSLTIPVLSLLFMIVVVLTWWHPAATYRHLRYSIDDAGIVIRSGIFWRTQSSLARVRIQHTDVAQGPLQRHYGIATLKLYTAGSHHTKIELPGLAHGTAVDLRNALRQEGDGDAV